MCVRVCECVYERERGRTREIHQRDCVTNERDCSVVKDVKVCVCVCVCERERERALYRRGSVTNEHGRFAVVRV